MTNKFLTGYLLLSIILILAGISWVVFSQGDSATKPIISLPDLTREQQDIIRNIYQLPAEPEAQVSSAIVDHPQSATVTATQNLPVANNAKDAKYDTPYYLRNNPWSPHYRPGN